MRLFTATTVFAKAMITSPVVAVFHRSPMASNPFGHFLEALLLNIETANKVAGFVGGFLGSNHGAHTAHGQQAAGMREVGRGGFDLHSANFPVFDSAVALLVGYKRGEATLN